MGIKRKIRQVGNSLALVIPGDIFDFLNIEPVKYKLCQDENGDVFILILDRDSSMIDEKKFQKIKDSYAVIIPKALCAMWNLGLAPEKNRELELSFESSAVKWKLSLV